MGMVEEAKEEEVLSEKQVESEDEEMSAPPASPPPVSDSSSISIPPLTDTKGGSWQSRQLNPKQPQPVALPAGHQRAQPEHDGQGDEGHAGQQEEEGPQD